MPNYEMYLYVPSRTEKGPMTRYDLNLTGMPCIVGSPEWAGDCLPDTCVFCSETLGPKSSYRRLLCGHFFHLPCIDSWICNQDASCPICRRTFYHLRRQRHVIFASAQSQRSDLSRSRTRSSESGHHRLERAVAFFKEWLRERDS
ncbi:hypothetical protein VTN96DRAFT_1830 [Rasamsonia emersonii]